MHKYPHFKDWKKPLALPHTWARDEELGEVYWCPQACRRYHMARRDGGLGAYKNRCFHCGSIIQES